MVKLGIVDWIGNLYILKCELNIDKVMDYIVVYSLLDVVLGCLGVLMGVGFVFLFFN